METTLSSKGQIVLPSEVRRTLALRPGTRFACRLANGTIVLTPKTLPPGKPHQVRDRATGLIVTKGPANGPTITSKDVSTILTAFP